jgi:poly(A) polymerase
MAEPRVIPRADHSLSRRDIDADALKVLHRLRQFDHIAYLVGGSVRDLLLGLPPKDFDIGTSAHPYLVKKLFRNCWIIGRRFRLAHVKFGPKIIEVATFRRQIAPGEEIVQDGVPAAIHPPHDGSEPALEVPEPESGPRPAGAPHLLHRDNTFGTPEEDAFRRDFTINALFYDIATFSIIDYVGGLDDLQARLVRSIGDPDRRMLEDPVRMLRAVALAARLDFSIEPGLERAIRLHRREIAHSSPPRLLEEYYKILRAGWSERAFRALVDLGLVEPISPELHHGAGPALWKSLVALDAYRRQFTATPEGLTNAILLGSLLVPVGLAPRQGRSQPSIRLGELPLARRDLERLRQLLALQRRLLDVNAAPGARRAVSHRSVFPDALTWLEIHGGVPEVVANWRAFLAEAPGRPTTAEGALRPPRRRRRRRGRRRFRPAPS